jgi:hypothetical protein
MRRDSVADSSQAGPLSGPACALRPGGGGLVIALERDQRAGTVDGDGGHQRGIVHRLGIDPRLVQRGQSAIRAALLRLCRAGGHGAQTRAVERIVARRVAPGQKGLLGHGPGFLRGIGIARHNSASARWLSLAPLSQSVAICAAASGSWSAVSRQ